MKTYFVILEKDETGTSILGGDWTEEGARTEAERNSPGAKQLLVEVEEELGERIENAAGFEMDGDLAATVDNLGTHVEADGRRWKVCDV